MTAKKKRTETHFVNKETVIKTQTIIKTNVSKTLWVQPSKVCPSLILCGETLCGEKLLTDFSQDWDLVLESRRT